MEDGLRGAHGALALYRVEGERRVELEAVLIPHQLVGEQHVLEQVQKHKPATNSPA